MKRLSPNRKIQNQSAGIAAGYLLRHLKSEGVSIRQAADTLQLPLATLKLKNPTLGLKPYNDLFEWAALELGDEFLGIHMAEQGDLSEIGILG
ncbi:MAG: hypothetical protein OIF35_11705, partial [Cellvibrionaceae bacterium]|nr:hypothetical protein [Cellvibrionaceae bacterium]